LAAIDTIASFQTTVGSTLAAGVMATGDSATVRNFPDTSSAQLIAAYYDSVTSALTWRIRSALLHDNVDGIQFDPGASAPSLLIAPQILQPVRAQDQLVFEFTTAASTGKALGAAMIYYPSLPGAMARLYSVGDIQGNIDNVKPLRVSIGSGANTAGIWLDTVITTTENLLHANTDYAVLGAGFNQAVACVGVKGTDTGNLRVCAPGGTNNPYGPQFFAWLSAMSGLPTIPVINAANAGSTFVSIISSAATSAAGFVTLYLAELSHNLS
jgi:hypothetical protein